MKTVTKQQTRRRKSRPFADAIMQGVCELEAMMQSGRRPEALFTVRTVEIPEPRQYNAKAVRALRDNLGVSQHLFAKLLGVSTILVQSWERGVRVPSPLARRLLDTIRTDPAGWLGSIRQTSGRRAG
jgi:DNA-binding transcriptional regulator YiaG